MIKSMTGFGRGEYISDTYSLKVEMKSVNHRYGDINIKMPRYCMALEEDLRRMIKASFHRGKLDVYINIDHFQGEARDILIDMDLARDYKNKLDNLKDFLDLDEGPSLRDIISLPEIISLEKKDIEEDDLWISLKEGVSIAIDDLDKMRLREGSILQADILKRLELIEKEVFKIEDLSLGVGKAHLEKLRKRLEEMGIDRELIDEDRLLVEFALLVDRANIDEEITRLKSHIFQFREALSQSDPVGRKLDFLIQEMNREVNTIGSKANDGNISSLVVVVKAELEKIREQVQNIE